MVSEQIEESLNREIESYVERRLSGIKQDITRLQTQVTETCKLLIESEGEDQWDGSLAAAVTEHLHAAHERGVELAASESARSQASSDMAIIKAAIEEMQGQHSQSEVLNALVNRGSSFAPRVAFFVIKGDQVRGWRARGFQGTIGDEAVQQISFPLLTDTLISEATRSRTTWSGTPDSHSENQVLLSRLGEDEPQRIVAVPLVVRGKTVAVLFADSAGLDSEALNLEALETLVRFASMAVELLSVARAIAPTPQVAASPEAAVGYTPAREYAATPEALPEEQPQVETVAPQPTDREPTEELGAETIPYTPFTTRPTDAESGAEIAAEEPVAEAVASEAATEVVAPEPVAEVVASESEPEAFAPEPVPEASFADLVEPEGPEAPAFTDTVVSEPAPTPLAGRRRYGSYDAELPIAVADEEERRAHNDARRFARLLVSEIKLYNEDKVVEGRVQGDLYARLREYIDRSRDMYDKRVKPVVAARYDYFHHELVNTLAEGDGAKLGAAYPGTTVSA